MAVADHNDQNGDPEVKQRSCCLLGHGGNRFARLLDELGGQASQDQPGFLCKHGVFLFLCLSSVWQGLRPKLCQFLESRSKDIETAASSGKLNLEESLQTFAQDAIIRSTMSHVKRRNIGRVNCC